MSEVLNNQSRSSSTSSRTSPLVTAEQGPPLLRATIPPWLRCDPSDGDDADVILLTEVLRCACKRGGTHRVAKQCVDTFEAEELPIYVGGLHDAVRHKQQPVALGKTEVQHGELRIFDYTQRQRAADLQGLAVEVWRNVSGISQRGLTVRGDAQ